jgi:hypothetical protein
MKYKLVLTKPNGKEVTNRDVQELRNIITGMQIKVMGFSARITSVQKEAKELIIIVES